MNRRELSAETAQQAVALDGTTHEVPPLDADLAADGAQGRAVVAFFLHGHVQVAQLAPGASVIVGRSAPAAVVLEDRSLSRQHAELRNDGTRVTLRDLSSRNGTFVHGERVSDEIALCSGMEFRMGAVVAQIRITGGAPGEPAQLETQDVFLQRLAQELVRARSFARPVSVLMLRASTAHCGGALTWCGRIRDALRPVDSLASYGHSAALVLLPEMGPELAHRFASSLILQAAPEAGLLCGVASFPHAARTRDEMLSAVHEATGAATLEQRVVSAEGTRALESAAPQEIVLRSPSMLALYELVRRAAPTDAPVLVQGESGAGKELVAVALHREGRRRDQPLRIINCGALPPTLTEGLLFGHERGAYTGADKRRKGIFEQAHGGTVFLDEVGELSPGAQVALLRVLETKRLTRLGGTDEIAVDVRIVAATHCDLAAMIEQKRFRADLFYRLTTLTLNVPPLRERPEDIAPLAELFLRRASSAWHMPAVALHPDALDQLLRYAWPGNVRELRNVIERAVILGQGSQVLVEHLPEELRRDAATDARPSAEHADAKPPEHGAAAATSVPPSTPPSTPDASLRDKVRGYEADLIRQALSEAGGNRARAAALLDMPLRTLAEKIRALDIDVRAAAKRVSADMP